MKQFNDYEIHPVYENKEDNYCEVCEPENASFYSLYGHIQNEGILCIGDYKDFESAKEMYQLITGKIYE